jgi:hypothetical protein
MKNSKEVKVTDPIRHPNIQIPIEKNVEDQYKKMLGGMTRMLTVVLTHSILK